MTPAGPGSDPTLSAWHRRFPDRHLRAARLRLWRVELPVRPPSALGEWMRKATADGTPPAAAAGRLGLPPGIVRAADRPVRQWFAFLDLPGGPLPVPVPSVAFDPCPDPMPTVPPAVMRPPGVDVMPMTGDWRTIPIVRAEVVDVVAVESRSAIELYGADNPEGPPLWQVPPDVWPVSG